MRENIRAIVQRFSYDLKLLDPVIEFGSLQVPGQEGFADLRPFFPQKKYIGCDIRRGVGVDRIENLHKINLPDGFAGTVITMETIEHVENPFLALDEINRILKPGGYLLMSSHMNFPIHNHPYDYWRFTPASFYLLMRKLPVRRVFTQGQRLFPHTVLGVACKNNNQACLDLFIKNLYNLPGEPIVPENETVPRYFDGYKGF